MAEQKQEQPWPYEWMPPFLLALRNSANVRASCQAAGISRKEAYKRRASLSKFREAWDEAVDDALDVLEAVAFQRAREFGKQLRVAGRLALQTFDVFVGDAVLKDGFAAVRW